MKQKATQYTNDIATEIPDKIDAFLGTASDWINSMSAYEFKRSNADIQFDVIPAAMRLEARPSRRGAPGNNRQPGSLLPTRATLKETLPDRRALFQTEDSSLRG